MLPLVYIAGPFRGKSNWDIAQNVRAAERFGLEVARMGGMPVIPHANTWQFHGELHDQFWVEGTLRLLSVCDALVLIPGWVKSTGSRGEREWWVSDGGRLDRLFDLEKVGAMMDLRSWILRQVGL